jgi:hypothetical protein
MNASAAITYGRRTDLTVDELARFRFRTRSTGKIHRAYINVDDNEVTDVRPICRPNTGGFIHGTGVRNTPATCDACGDGPSVVVYRVNGELVMLDEGDESRRDTDEAGQGTCPKTGRSATVCEDPTHAACPDLAAQHAEDVDAPFALSEQADAAHDEAAELREWIGDTDEGESHLPTDEHGRQFTGADEMTFADEGEYAEEADLSEYDGGDSDQDAYQLATVLADVLADQYAMEDRLTDYDLPQVEQVGTFENLREHVSNAAEALRFDPTGDAPGVAVTFADGRKLAVRLEWI